MTHLIKIGNSQGIRIPKAIIEQAHLAETELKLKVTKRGLLISPSKQPRKGWKEKIEHTLKKYGDEPTDNEWIEAELTSDENWEW